MKNNILSKIFQILVLFILPSFFLTEGILLQKNNGPFYLRGVDPEYYYLTSSIALAKGSISLNTDHPGTPLQVMMCITNRIKHFFRNDLPFIEDVICNPEDYLHTDIVTLISIISIIKSRSDCNLALLYDDINCNTFIYSCIKK